MAQMPFAEHNGEVMALQSAKGKGLEGRAKNLACYLR
jgi:hypothetical protein